MARSTEKQPAYADAFIGPREPMMLINMPFPGFYESLLSDEVDRYIEQEVEYLVESQTEEKRPAHEHLTGSDFFDLFYDCIDFSKLHELLAHSYCDAQANTLDELFGFPLGIVFESMDSPREYNFCTDRLFAHIPVRVVKLLHAIAESDDGANLCAVIKYRHSSHSGFISFYPSDCATWIAKNVSEFDHNEIETVLLAAMKVVGVDDDHQMNIYYAWVECYGISDEFGEATDWNKLEAKTQILRDKKLVANEEALAELRETDPHAAAFIAETHAPRCNETLDLFK